MYGGGVKSLGNGKPASAQGIASAQSRSKCSKALYQVKLSSTPSKQWACCLSLVRRFYVLGTTNIFFWKFELFCQNVAFKKLYYSVSKRI